MDFTIRETVFDKPGWRADGSYEFAPEPSKPLHPVWQIFEGDRWVADCYTPTCAELAVMDLEFAVEESKVLDLTDDSVD